MLVDEGLGRIAEKEFRDDSKTNIFFAVKSLLKDVAAVTVGRELDDAAPTRGMN
jgi:hypothetical protein